MRIIGGQRRGLRLADVGGGDAAAHLRPTSDRIRETIFNLLINGGYANPLNGARVLDLFAGTGALGLEALSRGAAHATFVDDGATALGLIKRNVTLMDAASISRVLRQNATRLPYNPDAPHEIAFLDPPYGKGLGETALKSCAAGNWLAPGALVVWEEGTAPPLPSGFTQMDQRKYGDTVITILRAPGLLA